MEKIPDNNNYGGSDDRVLLRPKGLGIFAFFVMWVGYSAVWFLMETFSLSCCQFSDQRIDRNDIISYNYTYYRVI
jgi:hypothetical protein